VEVARSRVYFTVETRKDMATGSAKESQIPSRREENPMGPF